MRPTILLYLLFAATTIQAQEAFPPVSTTIDSLLEDAFVFQKKNDTAHTEERVEEVQRYLNALEGTYPAYRGLIHFFLSYYTFHPVKRVHYRNTGLQLIKGSGKFLPDQYSIGMFNVMQLHYNSRRMKEWMVVDTAFKKEILPSDHPDSLRYALIDYANEKLNDKAYKTAKQLALYDYYIFMHHNSALPMDKLSLMYADWLIFKADFDQWLELPFEFRYAEDFSRQTNPVYQIRKLYTREHYELRDKNYKSIFLELISRMQELKNEMVVENSYDKPGTNRALRRGYYQVYMSLINSFYKWALTEHKEGQVILPLKQFINQDIIPNEFSPAIKHGIKPVITGYEYLELVRNLANLYHQIANGLDERETIFLGYEFFASKKLFTENELDYALVSLTRDRVRAERLLSNYEYSLKGSKTSKILASLPDTVNRLNLGRWENFMDARIQEIYTILESGNLPQAIDSLQLLMGQISPLDDGTSGALVYNTESWPHLQFLVATIKAYKGEWMTELLQESLADIEKQSPLPEIYYPVQLLYFKSLFHKEKKIHENVLSNLLIYTGRQLRHTFMMLTAEDRMLLYEKKLSPFFDVYHELLFRGQLDKFPQLREKVIAQSLSLKNSLVDGNLIPNEVFLRKNKATNEEFVERLRELRQEVNLNLLNNKMEAGGAPESRKLKDRVQDMWLELLEKSGMDSLVQLTDWKKISAKLKPGQVYTETVRYQRWLGDSTAHYGAFIILPGGKIKVMDLYAESKLVALLNDPASSPQTSSLSASGNRGGQVSNTSTESRGEFKKGSIDLLGKFLLKPLWPYLVNQKEWLMVQDGLLNRISIASLQWNFKNMFEYIQLSQLSGSHSLFQKTTGLPKGGRALLAGGLDYGHAESDNSQRLFKSEYAWSYLPGTKKETEILHPVFNSKGWETKTITGKNFPDSLINILPQFQVVHLATHGFYLDSLGADKIYASRWNRVSLKNEPLFRSGIVMSNANDPDTLHKNTNGYFLGYELANTDLRKCYLVSLSACETGLGDLRNNLGVDGLSRALKIGGARHLLISLWKVPDQPTAIFMEKFYKDLFTGKTPAQALRTTQAFMSRTYRAKDWAAFVLVE